MVIKTLNIIMRKFEIVIFKCGSLEILKRGIIVETETIEEARLISIRRYRQPGTEVGVQST